MLRGVKGRHCFISQGGIVGMTIIHRRRHSVVIGPALPYLQLLLQLLPRSLPLSHLLPLLTATIPSSTISTGAQRITSIFYIIRRSSPSSASSTLLNCTVSTTQTRSYAKGSRKKMPPKKEIKQEKVLLGRPGNSLKSGIVGLANVGKSTLFQAITKCSLGNPAVRPPLTTTPP